MPQSARVFRVFVSSTFSDMVVERNALQERVFPGLRELCFKHGARFQAIDLRWGISAEAALNQRSVELCLNEIRRCQQVTKRPNFILLLGDRYGWCPLPDTIPADEFEVLEQRISPDDRLFVKQWYCRDDNAVPSVYILQPRRGEYIEKKRWEEDERRLRQLLLSALKGLDWTYEKRLKYEASVTEQEITAGIFNNPDAAKSAFCFFRTFDAQLNGATSFAEADEQTRQQLANMKRRLHEHISNIYTYHAQISGNEITIDHLDQWCEEVYNALAQAIMEEAATFQAISPLKIEHETHEAFMTKYTPHFVGRSDALQAVAQYIETNLFILEDDLPDGSKTLARGVQGVQKDQTLPLVLHGKSGVGKSTVMAKAIQQTQAVYPHAEILYRFIGVTPESSTIRTLLVSLCQDIGERYGKVENIPQDYDGLIKTLLDYLALATPDRPLILFLDALDQLQTGGKMSDLRWLPASLPAHVKLIVSSMPDVYLESLERRVPRPVFFGIQPLEPVFAEELLDKWLYEANRRLQPAQRTEVLNKASANGFPLYLRLAFEEAKHWHSYTRKITLQGDVPSLVKDNLFARLANKAEHGEMLVSRSMGYLAASRYGLAEDEILDVLAEDDEFWAQFLKNAFHTPPRRQLPVAVWSRLYFDLEPYLTERKADGISLIVFYYRKLGIAVQERYAGAVWSQKETKDRHKVLAQYFQQRADPSGTGTWDGNYPRALSELPFHLTQAEMWNALGNTLTDFRFLERKGTDINLVERTDTEGRQTRMYTGVLLLQDDFEFALERLSATRELTDIPIDHAKFLMVIDAIAHAFRREAHILMGRPDIVWQQMFNRLHWEPAPSEKTPLAEVLHQGLDVKQIDPRPWFRQMNRIVESKQLVRTLIGHRGEVNACQFNPKGKEIVSAGADGTLRLWNGESGELLTILGELLDDILCCTFSPDGQMIASGHLDGSLRLWDMTTYSLADRIETGVGAVLTCTFSQDHGKILVGGSEGSLVLWNVVAGKQILRTTSQGNEILSCDLSPSSRFAISSCSDGTFAFWNLEKEQTEAVIWGSYAPAYCCRFSLDGKWIVSAHSDYIVRLFDAATQREEASFEGHQSEVLACNFSPDGTYIVSGSMDGTIRVWEVSSGDEILVLTGHTAWINSCSFDASSRFVVSSSADETLKIWDVAVRSSALVVDSHTQAIASCAFSRSGKWLATASVDKTVRIWDVQKGNVVSVLVHSSVIGCASFSPDEKFLVTGCEDRTIHIWDWAARHERALFRGHTQGVRACLFTLNGKQVISASADKTIRLWDIQTRSEIAKLTGHKAGVESCALSSDGNLLVSASEDGTLKVWDLKRLSEISTLRGHKASVMYCRFSPDGTKIASASFDRTVIVWSTASGQKICTLTGCTAEVKACAFSPDGRLVASADWDKMIRVWDLASGTEIALYPALGNLLCCEFSPVGNLLAAGDEFENLYLLQLERTKN